MSWQLTAPPQAAKCTMKFIPRIRCESIIRPIRQTKIAPWRLVVERDNYVTRITWRILREDG